MSTVLGPTFAGFMDFVYNTMQVPLADLPTDSAYLVLAYEVATETVNLQLSGAAPALYTLAVYNLGGSTLIYYTPDQPGRTFWADLRKQWNIYSFVAGVIQSTSDEGTSESLLVADVFKNLTLADLQNLKDPYGRAYLAIAMNVGTLWGVS